MSEPIYVVSGLPRSGTSMMMKMLEDGGLPPLLDGIRKADDDNPKGYYEFERVKKLKQDKAWLPEAQGKVVKVISQLLFELPEGFEYRIVFVRRSIAEILASQQQMMIRRGTLKEGDVGDDKMRDLLLRHLDQVFRWLAGQAQMKYAEVDYNKMLQDPGEAIGRINALCGGKLDTAAMARVVDTALYRQRK
ncbi:MAG: sulfotransferase family protein [Deltaproteobacteria bacterium]|nr:sulfotransferase family protein [Deltaproteobacteria bacterium]